MVFSQELQQQIHQNYQEALPFFGKKKDEIQQAVAQCPQPQRLFMEFLYSAMPLSDVANYSFETFYSYADHAAFLLEKMPWCQEIPPEIFLNEVLFHRVNSEEITSCRPAFFQQAFPVVQNKPMEQAILDLNYWCLENATYRLTDDRTASPLTVLRCAYGRCGEESTFGVTALRSVGIPARQVYVPKWGHCDDNHAWVEVWCGGQWYYLGACEPEEVLDKGWFTAAASRAMVVHSRTFAAHGQTPVAEQGEEFMSKEGCVLFWNQLPRYAEVTKLHISIAENGTPVCGAELSLELLNYSRFSPIAGFVTGEDGAVDMTVGLGDLHIHARKGEQFAVCRVDTRTQTQVEIDFSAADFQQPEEWAGENFEMLPPKDSMRFWTQLPEEVTQRRQQRFDQAVAKRKAREELFPTAAQGVPLLQALGYEEPLARRGAKCMEMARGNAPQIMQFLQPALSPKDREYRLALLESLTEKDYTDLKAEILEEALACAMEYEAIAPRELFVPYVMCPRVSLEVLQPWRKALLAAFSQEEGERFRAQPSLLWQWVCSRTAVETDREYGELITNPSGLLAVGRGTSLSQRVLFTAACRTLGIPARLSPQDGVAQYWQQGWVNAQTQEQWPTVEFTITTQEQEPWVYTQNWSLARLENGAYHTLNLSMEQWQGAALKLPLKPGFYRLLTCKRMPTGGLFAKEYRFKAGEGQPAKLAIAQRSARLNDLLENREIPGFALKTQEGAWVQASAITEGKKNILLWLEEGKEPTEHILNEMLDQAPAFAELDGQILFILKTPKALKDEKIRRVLESVPHIQIYYDDFRDTLSSLARRMYVDPDKLPLVILTNTGLNGIYGSSGYNVGLGALILKILSE